MGLQDLWFILIGVLFVGFFFLEGFDYGVGILLPFLGKKDEERRVILNTIGPHWDANEVWMITAGGAIFAAFPQWYATLFSGFYLALLLILVALIVRGVAFEFRSKEEGKTWRAFWDWMIFIGSLVPALLWGVAFGNLVQGTPIGPDMNFTGNFFDLLSPYTLLTGVASLALFILHGAVFLTMKTDGVVRERAEALAKKLWQPVLVILALLVVAHYVFVDVMSDKGVVPGIAPVAAALSMLGAGWALKENSYGKAFLLVSLTIVFSVITFFWMLHPNVMISSTDPAYNLTVDNASASDKTLEVMTVVALILVPIMLIYQAWTYWVFRQRISTKSELEY